MRKKRSADGLWLSEKVGTNLRGSVTMRLGNDGNTTDPGERTDNMDTTSTTSDVIAYVYGLARRAGGTGYRQWREIWVRAVDVQDAGDVLIATSDYDENWEFPKPFIRRFEWYEET